MWQMLAASLTLPTTASLGLGSNVSTNGFRVILVSHTAPILCVSTAKKN